MNRLSVCYNFNMRIIDISLPISPEMPVYPGNIPTQTKEVRSSSGMSVLTEFSMTTHAGTHIDAPSHAISGAKSLDKIALEKYFGPCRVVDVSECIDLVDAKTLKQKNIQAGERILLKTSNSQRGFKEFYPDFVYLAPDGAELLALQGVTLVGIDALSIKQRGSQNNVPHTALLTKEIPILEGINLKGIEEGLYTLCAFPINFQATDGAPARAVLFVE